MSILNIQSNTDLIEEEARQAAVTLEARQSQAPIPGLAAFVRTCFEAAAQHKKAEIEDRLLDCLRRRRGEYPPEELQEIRQAGPSDIYMRITDAKCHGALSWIQDLLLSDDKPWGIDPTPEPDLPPEVAEGIAKQVAAQAMAELAQTRMAPSEEEIRHRAQEAREQVIEAAVSLSRKEDEKLERKIEDVLEEGGWRKAMNAFLNNFVTFPAAFIKAPVWEIRATLAWPEGGGQPVVTYEPVLTFKVPSPFDIFPSPLSSDTDDGYLCELHRLNRRDLVALKGVNGYDIEAIDAVLEHYGRGGLDDWNLYADPTQRRDLEGKSNTVSDPEGRITAVQFWGYIQGQQLLDYGMDETQVPDPLEEYAAEVWIVDRYVIKAELNGDALGRTPYHRCCFRDVPGSFWGLALPELVADCQDMANKTARNLCNNQSISSGPMVGVDIGQFATGENVTELYPWKQWQFDMARSTSTRPPMWFFQPDSHTAELLQVYRFFTAEADDASGIPRYLGGDNPKGGAAGTASGLSMLLGNTSKGIKRVVGAIGDNIVEPTIQRTYEALLMVGELTNYRGDIRIKARGSEALVAKEQATMRRNEFLQIVMGSPLIQQIMGLPAIADLLAMHVRSLAIGADDLMPSGETVRKQQQAMEMQQTLAAAKDANAALMAGGARPQKALPEGQPQGKAPNPAPAGAPGGNNPAAAFGAPQRLPVQPPQGMGGM